ncbi:LysR family transcriptional regulator [Sinorhizobium sp. 7-81]|uniref:LysR family transcriptional regulator n=1 Tax=Sinorhizobium sp. 8-89 TaxID=3049089 RepID=UPI0024C2C000|nr:LysR family transcriptional regulator [Sinorhizobium sp. 8-89]MDK1490214.1 LysR family transcriptional regulator [Sinorhizobium sp. 8-89]
MPKSEQGRSTSLFEAWVDIVDIATIVLVDATLREGGIRRAAKLSGRPPSSVSAAVRRFEQTISVPLLRREGAMLVPTLEAQARIAEIAEAAETATLLANGLGRRRAGLIPPVSLAALDRFVKIARNGSIRSVARMLGLGQPQLTRQMAGLERHLGYRLFERAYHGVVCTEEALAALPLAEKLLQSWGRLTRASDDRFRRDATTWRLGAVMPLGPESEIARMLAALTAAWHAARPRQHLFISSTTADELIAGLKSRRFDAALLDVADFPNEFEGRLVSETPLALAGAAGTLSEISGDFAHLLCTTPIAVPSAKSGLRREATRFLEDTLSESERRRVTLIEVDSIPVIINLVSHHGYLSILPESSLARVHRPPAMIRLAPAYKQSLTLVWPRKALWAQAGEAMFRMMKNGTRPQ